MRLPLVTALALVAALSACGSLGSSRLNPLTWFGGGREEPLTLVPEGGYAVVEDNRALVERVAEIAVERMPGGAIVRAVGIAPTQGWWDAELVAENGGVPVDGVLAYRFVIAEPAEAQRVSSEASRRITAAVVLTDRALAGVRQIVVRGQTNQMVSARR